MKSEFLQSLVSSPTTRRDFARRLGLTGVGVVGAGVLSSTIVGSLVESAQAQTSTITDVDILNFALNLEYLEAEFYTAASDGTTIAGQGVIPSSAVEGPTTGVHRIPNVSSSPIAYILSALKRDEQDHVRFLRGALGSAAVKKPTINLAALGDPFANWTSFLRLARAFEDVGVSAYAGAAALIQNKTYLDAAARILSAESQHSGALRVTLIRFGMTVPAVDSKDVPPTPERPFFLDAMALAIPRSTSEVLRIVYGGGATRGGFFPEGVNGRINAA